MSAPDLALASAIVLLASAVQGAVGFGFALISAPLLLLVDPRLVPGPIIAVALFLSVSMVVRERSHIAFEGMGWGVAGRLPGTIAGAAAVGAIPVSAMGIPVGIIVLLAVAMSASHWRLRPGPRTLVGAGLLSGFMGTTSSIGGPPLALVYQNSPGPVLRSTLSVYFVIGTALSLPSLWYVGRFGAEEFWWSLALLPGCVAGFAFSGAIARLLDRGYTRSSVLAVSAAAGALVILRELF